MLIKPIYFWLLASQYCKKLGSLPQSFLVTVDNLPESIQQPQLGMFRSKRLFWLSFFIFPDGIRTHSRCFSGWQRRTADDATRGQALGPRRYRVSRHQVRLPQSAGSLHEDDLLQALDRESHRSDLRPLGSRQLTVGSWDLMFRRCFYQLATLSNSHKV